MYVEVSGATPGPVPKESWHTPLRPFFSLLLAGMWMCLVRSSQSSWTKDRTWKWRSCTAELQTEASPVPHPVPSLDHLPKLSIERNDPCLVKPLLLHTFCSLKVSLILTPPVQSKYRSWKPTCSPPLQCSDVRISPGKLLGRSKRLKYHTRFQKMMGCWLMKEDVWITWSPSFSSKDSSSLRSTRGLK